MLGKHKKLTPQDAFGLALREFRKKAKLTQEELALEAGIERNYVSLIELGKNQPTITMIFKIASALNVDPSKIIKSTENKLDPSRLIKND